MSHGSQFDDGPYEDEHDGTPQKKGWSTGAKVAVILGGCCALLLVVCCGAVGFIGYKARQAMTTDPAVIATIQSQILTSIDLPEGFQPQIGMNLAIAGQGMMMVAYGDAADPEQSGATMLILMQMTIVANEAEMRRELEKSLGNQKDINIESSETKTVTIDGQPVEFRFAKGTSREGGEAVRQVTGVFPGKSGSVMLILVTPEESWDEQKVMGILESIKK